MAAGWTRGRTMSGMSDAFHDPRSHVDAPVVRALELIVVRGAASFAVAVVAVLTTVWSHDGPLHTVGHLALPIVPRDVVAARAIHVWLARHDPVAGDGAWSRAGDVDAGNARFAAVVVALVPVAWLALAWLLPAFLSGMAPLLVILPGIVGLSVAKVLTSYLSGIERLAPVTLAAVAALAINLVANLVLIPAQGIVGAAAASLISYTAYGALMVAASSRASGSPWSAFVVPRAADVRRLWSGLGRLVGAAVRPAA